MKYILKIKPAPKSFVEWLQTDTTKELIKTKTATSDSSGLWSALADDNTQNQLYKTDLWLQLCREQGYICAYCGQKLIIDKQRIEHFAVKSQNMDTIFDYDNLLAVCDSTENQKGKHCDVKRGSKPIFVNPTDKNCENRVFYNQKGEVIGKDAEATITIQNLGLNDNENLRRDRKKYYEEAKKIIEQYLYKNNFKKDTKFCAYLNKITQKLLVEHDNQGVAYREYCFVDYQIYKQSCPNLLELTRNIK